MKKHCKTFNRENKIYRVKITSDPKSSETDPRILIRMKLKLIRNTVFKLFHFIIIKKNWHLFWKTVNFNLT